MTTRLANYKRSKQTRFVIPMLPILYKNTSTATRSIRQVVRARGGTIVTNLQDTNRGLQDRFKGRTNRYSAPQVNTDDVPKQVKTILLRIQMTKRILGP